MVLIAVFHLMSRAYIILPAAEGPAAWCMDTWLVMQMSGRWEHCSSWLRGLQHFLSVVRVRFSTSSEQACFCAFRENVTCKNYGGKTLSHKPKNSRFVSRVIFFFPSNMQRNQNKTKKKKQLFLFSPHLTIFVSLTPLSDTSVFCHLSPLPAVYFHNTTLCFSLSHNSILSLSSPGIFYIGVCKCF